MASLLREIQDRRDRDAWLTEVLSRSIYIPDPAMTGIVAASVIYAKALLETLGQRSGDGLADLSKRLGELVRARERQGKQDGYLIGIEGATAMLIVTEDLPDEARLAVLDLDVTAEDVRGKTLRWDNEAMAWRPDGSEE
jgi:hypothetical protein